MPINGSPAETGLKPLLPALLVAAFACVVGTYGVYQAPDTGETAVFFAPGTEASTAMTAIAAAGGKLVGPTRIANVHVAYAVDSGFRARIKRHGGWFVLAAQGLCAPSNRNLI